MTPQVLSPSYFTHFEALNKKLSENPDMLLTLAFSDHGRFACSSCAACCDSDWGVLISEDYYNTWQPVWNAESDSRFHEPFVIKEQNTGRFNPKEYAAIKKQPNSNRCMFLESDNKCYIHKVHGEKNKPVGCQTYPQFIQPQFNGYSAMFLQKSCASAPALMLKDPQIYYFLLDAMPGEVPPLPEGAETDAFSVQDYYLFLGLVLDVLEVPSGSLIARYGSIHKTLTRLFLKTEPDMTWGSFYELAMQEVQKPEQLLNEEAKDRAKQLFQQLVKQIFPEIMTHPTSLAMQSEQFQLNQYLWVYLRQKLITQSYESLGQKFYSVPTHQLIVLCFLQMTLLYTRYLQGQEALTQTHFEKALNIVERRLAHQSKWIETFGISELAQEDTIHLFQALSQMTFQ